MQLIVITPDHDVENEQQIVNGLFASGLQRLHLRKPHFTAHDYQRYLHNIDPVFHKHIVIHGCFSLFEEYRLGGVHINNMMRGDEYIWAQIASIPHQQVSTSFHSWQEILQNGFDYGYVFISPVFDSISKQGYKAAIDMDELTRIKEYKAAHHQYCPAVIGLGGVGKEQIKTLHAHGFDGAAALGAVWTSADPVRAFCEILTMCR